MRVAWFHPAADTAAAHTDARTALVRSLAPAIQVDLVTESNAHYFVVEQERRPYDQHVYELSAAPGGEFVWGYLFHYPGVLFLRSPSVHDSRVRAFERHRRSDDYAVEFAFNHGHPPRAAAERFPRGSWPMLRAPILASRLVSVTRGERDADLAAAWPDANVRVVPPFAARPDVPGGHRPATDETAVHVSCLWPGSRPVVERAAARARDAGVAVHVLPAEPGNGVAPAADIVVGLESPFHEPSLCPALAAMSLGKAVVVFERESTAMLPALDAQNWRARDLPGGDAPAVVSVDPRDEEHSLMLALVGLARDRARRETLGSAARLWWQAHATPEHAAAAWLPLLQSAHRAPLPALPADWPAHLRSDGGEWLRAVAADLGVQLGTLW
jgi:hypothetical protein